MLEIYWCMLADKTASIVLQVLGMGAFCALISEWFWRLSVRRYTSAST